MYKVFAVPYMRDAAGAFRTVSGLTRPTGRREASNMIPVAKTFRLAGRVRGVAQLAVHADRSMRAVQYNARSVPFVALTELYLQQLRSAEFCLESHRWS